MKRLIILLHLTFLSALASAQHVTISFRDTPLSEALRQIDQAQSDKIIIFFYSKLEQFRVTTTIKDKPAYEAVKAVCEKLPVTVEMSGRDIYVKPKKEERTIFLSQFVRNSFTRYGISNTLVTVMDAEGNVIDTVRTQPGAGGKEAQVWTLTVPRRSAKFRIRAEHPDYEMAEMEVEMKNPARLNSYRLPDMLMKIKEKTVELNEAVVRATRVQLCYKGDTIVVDARAFKLPEGSMLDALVRSVPGCELHDNGDIYLNGKKVDYLMLNGKEFFKGNNRLMLDNLPYYTVGKLQFYNKRTERSEMMGKDVESPDFVMDVRLKQEYSIGYLGNVEAAVGTYNRWLGRTFGLRFTGNSRLALFGNANNVNENRQPGSNGDWSAANSPVGDTRLYNTGGELLVDDKFGRYKEVVNASASWTKSGNETRTASETYLPSGTVHGRSQQRNTADNFAMKAGNALTLKKLGLKSDTHFDISKSDADEWLRTGQFAQSPASLGSTAAVLDSIFTTTMSSEVMRILVNRTDESASLYNRRWNAQQDFNFHRELPWGDDIVLSAVGRWSDAKDTRRDHYLLAFPGQKGEAQERDTRAHDRSHDLRAGVSYSFHFLNHWHLTLSNQLRHQRDDAESNLYRLDWDETFATTAMLPSVLDYARLQDFGNSWKSLHTVRTNELSASIHSHKNDTERGRYTSFTATLPAHYTWATEDYTRGERHTVVSDHRWLFRPSVNLEHNTRRWRDTYIVNYKMDMRSPDLTQRVAFTDTSNPLRILTGNPDLRPSHSHTIDFTFHTRFGQHGQNLNLQSQAAIFCDLVAQSVTYHSTTGTYTFRPVNVSGNWHWRNSLTYRRALNEDRSLNLDAKTTFNYFRNVDIKADAPSRMSHYQTGESAKLEYKRGKLRLALTGSLTWNSIQCPAIPSQSLSSLDFDYGLSANLDLPWQLRLATDAKMYSRRGYTDRALNTDDLLWNAQLSRPFLRSRLLITLQAFDILHQISYTRTTINAQGRTERWQLSLPNYLMLSAQWKFNKHPKKNR